MDMTEHTRSGREVQTGVHEGIAVHRDQEGAFCGLYLSLATMSHPRHILSPVPKECSKVLGFLFGGGRLRRQLLFLDHQRAWAL